MLLGRKQLCQEDSKVYALLGKDDEAMKCKEERDRLNAVNPIPEIDMSDTSGRWME